MTSPTPSLARSSRSSEAAHHYQTPLTTNTIHTHTADLLRLLDDGRLLSLALSSRRGYLQLTRPRFAQRRWQFPFRVNQDGRQLAFDKNFAGDGLVLLS